VTARVVLADDQPLVRAGFRMILEAEDDIDVAGEASDGEEAVAVTRQLQPDVVLMDIQMPKVDGLEATRRIAQDASTDSRILILTTFERDDYVFEALRAGASGFMLKNAAPEDLVRAVRVVATGDALLDPAITRRVIEDYAQRAAPRKDHARLARLTEREREVLRLLATGKSNAELAAHLYLGEGTVKTHVSHVLGKLGLRDRVQAVVFAYETGLVEPGEAKNPPPRPSHRRVGWTV
jgi:DNA-binding NarL/FixJ family response regulator